MLERGRLPTLPELTPAQRHDLPVEPADLRRRATAGRTCASRTGCCRPGPTVADILANAAFYFGLVRTLAEQDRPIWTQMSFSAAEENFHSGARHGIDASLFWPGVGTVPVTELVLRRLLPLAAAGLDRWGVAAADRDRFLGIIEGRCVTRPQRCQPGRSPRCGTPTRPPRTVPAADQPTLSVPWCATTAH